MSEQLTFWQLYNKSVGLLNEKRLAEALSLIHRLVDKTANWQLLDELENIKSEYSLLLNYMKQGVNDPQRERQRIKFISRSYDLIEKAAYLMRSKEKAEIVTRTMPQILKDLEDLGMKSITSGLTEVDLQKHVALYTELFHCAKKSSLWNAEEEKSAEEVMNSALVSDKDKSVMLSALLLSNLYSFDAQKIIFFANQYSETENLQLRIQLLVCIVFPLQKYRSRLFAYNDMLFRLSLLRESPAFLQDIATLQVFGLESLATHDVNRKLREEIIPAMMKTSKFNPNKFGIDKVEDIDESNPEWNAIDKTIGELAELEAKGADVYYSTFSSLKRFPFFNEEANWFYPYDSNHPSVPAQLRDSAKKGIMQAMLDSDVLCDSDKYSFCMLTTQMSEEQLGLLASQIPGAEGLEVRKEKTRESFCRNYLRELFRYFYLYNGFRPSNPFEEDFTLVENPVFKSVFNDYDVLMRIGSYAMEKKNFAVASVYLEKCAECPDSGAETFQKLGFCHQKNKQPLEAVRAYEKAYALNGKSKWTLRHLAQVNMFVGNYKDALNYYKLLEITEEADANIAFRCGECLVRLERYDEAIKEFFKAEYLEPENVSASRALAWCSVLTGDVKQARRYYSKIISSSPRTDDFISAGHAAWIDGDMNEAASLYLRAASDTGLEEFNRKFYADSEVLSKYGIDRNEIMLMMDIVVMEMNKE